MSTAPSFVAPLAGEDDFEGWRKDARAAVLAGIAPEAVTWRIEGEPAGLFEEAPLPQPAPDTRFTVPRGFVELASSAILHNDPERFRLLHALLARLHAGERLMEERSDPLVRRLDDMALAVRRDMLRMRVGLRFHESAEPWTAAYTPEHHIERANAAFFTQRFGGYPWAILMPRLCLHWDGAALHESPGTDTPPALPDGPTTGGDRAMAWEAVREEAGGCRRCPLWKPASQTVFGEGPVKARIMLVGEQPGDQEDLAGRPFVGPAGQLLDRALAEAGIDRAQVYVTNSVKHFKFTPRGKRRIHSKPQTPEIEACAWWIAQERMLVRPALTVALGATAARALLGRTVTITATRGRPIELADGGAGWVTVHPSFLLRIDERQRAESEYARFVEDLRGAAHAAG